MAPTTPALVFVVDPKVTDYAALAELVAEGAWTIGFLGTGRDAIWANACSPPDLWIVNIRLPDMSGFCLAQMLRPHGDACVLMVADEYRAEDEIRALSLGVTLYLCKPLEASCLRQWRPLENP